MVQSHIFDQLSLQDQRALERIFDGTDLPPLYSDTIAKRVFNADVHPDRLNFLLQNIAKDDTIDVRSSASNESAAAVNRIQGHGLRHPFLAQGWAADRS